METVFLSISSLPFGDLYGPSEKERCFEYPVWGESFLKCPSGRAIGFQQFSGYIYFDVMSSEGEDFYNVEIRDIGKSKIFRSIKDPTIQYSGNALDSFLEMKRDIRARLQQSLLASSISEEGNGFLKRMLR